MGASNHPKCFAVPIPAALNELQKSAALLVKGKDASACEKSHGDPSNMEIATGMIEDVAMFADAHTQGFEAAAEQTGRDARVYDFTTALLEVFSDANTLKRYQRAKKTFKNSIEIIL